MSLFYLFIKTVSDLIGDLNSLTGNAGSLLVDNPILILLEVGRADSTQILLLN